MTVKIAGPVKQKLLVLAISSSLVREIKLWLPAFQTSCQGGKAAPGQGQGWQMLGGSGRGGLSNHLGGYRSLTSSVIIGTSGDVFLRGLTGAPCFAQVSPVMRPAACLGPDGSHPLSYLNLRTYCWGDSGWINPTVRKKRGRSQEDVCRSMSTIDKTDISILIYILHALLPARTIVFRQQTYINATLRSLSSHLNNLERPLAPFPMPSSAR